MIEVRMASLAMDSKAQPVVILKPVSELPGQGRLLPIWIGIQEATAIVVATQGATTARPLVYDLIKRLLEALDAQVEHVAVTRLEEGTFHAEIALRGPSGLQLIDARPSDSIAIAIRMNAPIFVAEDVLESAGVPDEAEEAVDDEAEVAAFTDFLDKVDPEDFRG